METYNIALVDSLKRAFHERDRFRLALRAIANINNGPDRASGEWRCIEAERIATDALAGKDR